MNVEIGAEAALFPEKEYCDCPVQCTGQSHRTNDNNSACTYTVKKGFKSFPSPAGMSLTKLPLGRNNSVMTSLFPPRESLVVTSRLGTGNSRTFFLRFRVTCKDVKSNKDIDRERGVKKGIGTIRNVVLRIKEKRQSHQ